jgi:DNA-binding transcriptional LysR family regulator
MDVKWIEDFLALAQSRSFSRAAEARNVTQPAFSRRIRALEKWLGAQLIDRSCYPLALTPAGALFEQSAGEAIRLLHDTRAMLEQRVACPGYVRIAAGHSLALHVMPAVLQHLRQHVPGLYAQIMARDVHDAVMALREGEADLLAGYHHPRLPFQLEPGQYDYLVLGHDVLTPVSIPARSGGAAFSLPGSAQAPLPLLAYSSGSYFAAVTQRILDEAPAPVRLQACHQSELAELLKRLALAGQGLAWLPLSSVASDLASGQLVRAGGEQWTLQLEVRLYRERQSKRSALDQAWQALRSVYRLD